MGGSHSHSGKERLQNESASADSAEASNVKNVIKGVETKIMLADGVGLEKSKLLEVMFAEGIDNCSSRGRSLMENCFEKLIRENDNNYLSSHDFEEICQLILDGHCDSNQGSNRDFHLRIASDRKLIKLLLLEQSGKPDPDIVEDILLLAYSVSLQPSPIVTGVEEDFASKLAVAMVESCSDIDALLLSWERVNLPIAYLCRYYFAQRLLEASSGSRLPREHPARHKGFPTPIGSFGLWILSEILPPTYCPPLPPMAQKNPTFTQWQLLFDSATHGLSFSRLEHNVFDYKSPTLILVGFNNSVFAVGVDCEWRRGVNKWGGPECCVFQLIPKFYQIESKPNMIVCNTKDRSVPKGISVGTTVAHLAIDEGLSEAKFYGVPSKIDWIQVIGCGESSAQNAQAEYRRLTTDDAKRLKDKKLHVDDWSLDSKILDWGGVNRGNLAKEYGVAGEFQHVEGSTSASPPQK